MKPTDGRDDGVPGTENEYLHSPGVAHEHDDISIRGLVIFAVGLAVLTVGVAGLMYLTFEGFERLAAQRDPELSPLALPAGQRPPEPRLLLDEPTYLREVRQREAQALQGGKDAQTGATRLSIDEAMKRIAADGRPVREGEAVDPRRGTHAPAMGESSGGRMLGAPRNTNNRRGGS